MVMLRTPPACFAAAARRQQGAPSLMMRRRRRRVLVVDFLGPPSASTSASPIRVPPPPCWTIASPPFISSSSSSRLYSSYSSTFGVSTASGNNNNLIQSSSQSTTLPRQHQRVVSVSSSSSTRSSTGTDEQQSPVITDHSVVDPQFTVNNHPPRKLLNTTTDAADSTTARSSSSSPSSFQLNEELVRLGRGRRWDGLLDLARRERRHFTHVHCATLLVQLARLHHRHSSSASAPASSALSLKERNALGRDPRLVQFVQALVEHIVHNQNNNQWWIRKHPREVSNMVHAFAKLQCHRNPRLRPGIGRLLDCITDTNNTNGGHKSQKFVRAAPPQSVSLVAWACATMKYRPGAAFAEQLDRTSAGWLAEEILKENNNQQQQQQLDPQAVSNVAWSCATLQLPAPHLMEAVNQPHAVEWLLKEGTPQCIGNTAWACATLHTPAPNLFGAIDRDAERLVRTGTTQMRANLAWACGALRAPAPHLFGLLGSLEASRRLVRQGTPQQIANTLWAFAKLKSHHPPPKHLLTALEVAGSTEGRLSRWNAQDLANTAWACATLGWTSAETLLHAIDSHAERLVRQGTPQNVTNTAWACATLNVDAPQLFYHMNRWEVAQWLVDCNSRNSNTNNANPTQTVANLAWACATLGYRVPVLMKAILAPDTVSNLVRHGSVREVANVVWACATLGVENEAVSVLLLELAKDDAAFLRRTDLDPQSVAILSYAISLLSLLCSSDNDTANDNHELHKTILLRLWNKAIGLYNAAGAVDTAVFRNEELLQLAQTQRLEAANGVDLPAVPERMAVAMEEALAQPYTNETSKASQEISELLREVGFDHELEVSPEALLEMTSTTASITPVVGGGMLAIDFACRAQKVAVEYDGPQHFLKAPTRTAAGVAVVRTTRTENGRTQAKRRYLQLCGWQTVIHLDYRDHQQAQRESNIGPKEWLASVMQRAGVSLSSS